MHGNNYRFLASVLHERFSINKLHKLLLNVTLPCDDLHVFGRSTQTTFPWKKVKVEEGILLQQNFNYLLPSFFCIVKFDPLYSFLADTFLNKGRHRKGNHSLNLESRIKLMRSFKLSVVLTKCGRDPDISRIPQSTSADPKWSADPVWEALHYCIIQYNTLHNTTVSHSTIHHTTLRHRTVQYIT